MQLKKLQFFQYMFFVKKNLYLGKTQFIKVNHLLCKKK